MEDFENVQGEEFIENVESSDENNKIIVKEIVKDKGNMIDLEFSDEGEVEFVQEQSHVISKNVEINKGQYFTKTQIFEDKKNKF